MPEHIISQWSDQQKNTIIWEQEQKAGAAWAALCLWRVRGSLWAVSRGDLSVNINQMQTNTSGGLSADLKQKSMNTFHSWLGRAEGLIELELVRLWGPPCNGVEQLWPAEIPGGLNFSCLYRPKTQVQHTHQLQNKILTHSCRERHT